MVTSKQSGIDPVQEELHFFPLEEVLGSGRAVVVNVSEPFVSLVSIGLAACCNPVIKQRRLRHSELRILLTLLAFPRFCSDELLLASLNCPWNCLLGGLFTQSSSQLQAAVSAHCEILQGAVEEGMVSETLKPLYNALYTLRRKLEYFELWVDSSPSGYSLVSLPTAHVPLEFSVHAQSLAAEHSGS